MPNIVHIAPADLQHLPTANPNVMEPRKYEQLVKNIRKHGFLQPPLVVMENSLPVLIDGVHRQKAALEIGLETIPCVVAKDRASAEVLRIAMNHVRGELDLTEIGRQLEMLEGTGLTMEDLEATGFADYEIKSLMELLGDDTDELSGVNAAPPDPTPPKSYTLSIKFDTESERALVREALETLADGGSTREGLEAALDTADSGWRTQ